MSGFLFHKKNPPSGGYFKKTLIINQGTVINSLNSNIIF